MAILGIILLIIGAFVILGILGWIARAFSWSIEFLGEGVKNFFGCFLTSIFWIAILLVLITIL